MSLRNDIRALYRANRNISSKEIIERLGITPTRTFWKILNDEQVSMRGLYPARRKNRNKPKAQPKGIVYFIPPEQEPAP